MTFCEQSNLKNEIFFFFAEWIQKKKEVPYMETDEVDDQNLKESLIGDSSGNNEKKRA